MDDDTKPGTEFNPRVNGPIKSISAARVSKLLRKKRAKKAAKKSLKQEMKNHGRDKCTT